MADVILVQPTVGLLDNIKTAPGLPLSLLSSVKFAVNDFDIKLIDQRLDTNWKNTLRRELKRKPLCIATTAMLGPQIEYAYQVAEEVKNIDKDVPVIWGGPHVSILAEQSILDPLVDIVVQGDGEITFIKLLKALKSKKSIRRIPGIYYKKDGEVIYTGPAPLVDLNKMPDIPYQLVNIKKYLPRRGDVLTLDMETSRGCAYRCRFCYNPSFNHGRWRALKAEIVLERVKKVVDQYKIHGIWFIDDEFFIDLNRARKIIQGLKKMKLHWTIQGVTAKSIMRMDDNFLRLLESAGCEQLNIGAESGSERILKYVNKGIGPRDILEVNRKLKPYKIMPWFYFMIGFPNETQKDVNSTINLCLRILKENPKAKISGIGCFTPYPGTSLFDEAIKMGFNPPEKLINWKDFAVDKINVPWISGKKKKEIEGIQFTSFFADKKANDVVFSPVIRAIAKAYRPIAKYRLKNRYWGFPIDVEIGNMIKQKLARERITL